MQSYKAENIRNIVLVGHGDEGKTSLAEQMLYLAGATDRLGNITAGNTVMDYDQEEIKRGMSISAAVALSKNGLDVPFFFNRKEAKDHGEGGVFVGYVPQAGEEIVIIEDVITAGTAIRESMEILSHLDGTKVIATFIMVDRKEKGQGEKGAMQEIEEQFGFPVYSVVDVYDIIEYLEEDPANEENVTRIKNYLAVNGAK